MPFTTIGPVELYFETVGESSSPTLLLVNGLGSQCINFDVELCQRFVDEGFFVIRFDNRDVGLSTKLDDVTPHLSEVTAAVREGRAPEVPYRLADMADDVVAVLDALDVDVAHVVGTSMGGMIVQQLAIDHPERLSSMTSIMSTTGDADVGKASPDVAARCFTRHRDTTARRSLSAVRRSNRSTPVRASTTRRAPRNESVTPSIDVFVRAASRDSSQPSLHPAVAPTRFTPCTCPRSCCTATPTR